MKIYALSFRAAKKDSENCGTDSFCRLDGRKNISNLIIEASMYYKRADTLYSDPENNPHKFFKLYYGKISENKEIISKFFEVKR